MDEVRQKNAETALEILENTLSVALRLRLDGGVWETLFITDNVQRLGYQAKEFTSGSLRWTEIIHPDDLDGVQEAIERAGADGRETFEAVYRVMTATGRSLWVMNSATARRAPDGTLLHWDGVVTDYSLMVDSNSRVEDGLDQHRVLNDILQAFHAADLAEAFQAILQRAGEYLDIGRVVLFEDSEDHTHCHMVYEWCNTGITPLAASGEVTLDYARDLPALAGQVLQPPGCATLAVPCLGIQSATVYPVHLDGKPYGFLCFDDSAHPRGWAGSVHVFLQNIANLVSTVLVRRDNEESIRRMAYYDQLTGLINRYRFDVYLQRAINDAREHDEQGYVLFIDMDDFKIINDGYGHDYGDALLIEVSDFLREHFEERAKLFRFGGDEFVVLVERHHAREVQSIIDDILMRGRHPWTVMDREFYCTLSLGVVRFPDGRDGVTEISKNADIALYQAKNMGKNNYVFYNRGLDDHSLQRAETERKMRAAIEAGCKDFLVYYQPLVNRLGEIVGAEALVRWQDGDVMVPPGEFIPLAEYLGLIVPLGEHVMAEAVKECRRINELMPDFFITVNVSIRQFQQRDFLSRVEDILRQTGTNPGNIVVEVTEGLVVQDIGRMKDMLEELHGMGLRIAMDDFGTGYSSLNNMRELPLDIIKIDRSFVRDVATDPYSKTFVRLIADLCHTMDRKVCVEGVETGAQYHYCVECQADTIQGFYFYKPMPQKALHKLLFGPGAQKAAMTAI